MIESFIPFTSRQPLSRFTFYKFEKRDFNFFLKFFPMVGRLLNKEGFRVTLIQKWQNPCAS
ncbi:hypothetical protein APT58_08310 [Corynebacterium glutamicum]|nr:hypothetical protein APT58_08310 [Corynebacterium glutamicum]